MKCWVIFLLSAFICSVADRDGNSQKSDYETSAKEDHEILLTTASGSHYRPADALSNSSSVEPKAEAHRRKEDRKKSRKHHRHVEELQRHVSHEKEAAQNRQDEQTHGKQRLAARDKADTEKKSAKLEQEPPKDGLEQMDWASELMGAFESGKTEETNPRQQDLKAERRSMDHPRDKADPSAIAEKSTSNLGHETASLTSPKSEKVLELAAEVPAKSPLNTPHVISETVQTVSDPTAESFAKRALSKPHVIAETGQIKFGSIDLNGDGFIDGVEFQNAVANGLVR